MTKITDMEKGVEVPDDVVKTQMAEISTDGRAWQFRGKTYITKNPTMAQTRMSDLYFAQAVREARDANLLTENELRIYLKEKGKWTDEDEAKRDKMTEELIKLEDALSKYEAKHGVKPNKTAKELATKLNEKRGELVLHTMKFEENRMYTAEAKAQEARIDYLVSACTYNEDGTPYWSSYEEFQGTQLSLFIVQARHEFTTYAEGLESNFAEDFIEVKYLREEEKKIKEAEVEDTITEVEGAEKENEGTVG